MLNGGGFTVLSVDVMGGDKAPESPIHGVKLALKNDPSLRFILHGSEEAAELAAQEGLTEAKGVIFCHASDVVTGDEKPSYALRNGRKSSMWLAISSVSDGRAQAVVSGGNTGAYMAISRLLLKSLPGVDRPAIVSTFPTQYGACVMLDLGANIVCDADNLVQFAVIGDAFARATLKIPSPRVALLNVGSEEVKGSDVVKAAAHELREGKTGLNFIGYIEGDGIADGQADVIVTDGFTGNVAVKTTEGTGKICIRYTREAFGSGPIAMLLGLLAKPYLSRVFKRLDPRLYNGAMLAGLGGIAVKSHGGSDAVAFANALAVAASLARNDVNGNIIGLLRGQESR